MKYSLKYLFTLCFYPIVFAVSPSTTITSDRMEMLRFKDHNEFTFWGKVQIRSKNFYGECEKMWVYTCSNTDKNINLVIWHYGKNLSSFKLFHWNYLLPLNQQDEKLSQSDKSIGQIKKIVATQHVLLEAQDNQTGELKRAYSEKADIFPNEGKMILTENPVVQSSQQGTFRGEKITFYKNSGRIIVENLDNKQRSQVLLSE